MVARWWGLPTRSLLSRRFRQSTTGDHKGPPPSHTTALAPTYSAPDPARKRAFFMSVLEGAHAHLPTHSLTLFQYILISNANPRASKHTNRDHDLALRGKFCTMLSHICEIAIGTLCADRQATVSCVCTLPLIKIKSVYGSIYHRIIPFTYEQRMKSFERNITSYSSLNVIRRSIR